MRCVVQRVIDCSIAVDGSYCSNMKSGLLVFVGISIADSKNDLEYMINKIINLRIFPDSFDKMNFSIKEFGGEITVVSQFTLYGDVRKGRRPSYDYAAAPDRAKSLFDTFINMLELTGIRIHQGIFQAHMNIESVNDGPVTILIDSEKQF